MVNKKIWLGMLVLVLAFGLTLVGCDDGNGGGGSGGGGGSTGLAGTWVSADSILELTNTTFESRIREYGTIRPFSRGNYSTNGNNMSLTVTHYSGAIADLSGWLSETDFRNMGMSQAEIDEWFFTITGTYSLSGNTLIITLEGDSSIYTRQ